MLFVLTLRQILAVVSWPVCSLIPAKNGMPVGEKRQMHNGEWLVGPARISQQVNSLFTLLAER
jgi:hypothetical protein